MQPAIDERLTAVAAAVIEAGGGRRECELRDLPVLEEVRADAGPLADRITATFGDRMVTCGTWHGDFSPWNMISTSASTALIDWEFMSDQMPVGSDLLHHRVMVATHLRDEPVEAPLTELVEQADNLPELHSLNFASEQHRPHLVGYFLELMRRDFERFRGGRPVTGFGAPAAAAADAVLKQVTGP